MLETLSERKRQLQEIIALDSVRPSEHCLHELASNDHSAWPRTLGRCYDACGPADHTWSTVAKGGVMAAPVYVIRCRCQSSAVVRLWCLLAEVTVSVTQASSRSCYCICRHTHARAHAGTHAHTHAHNGLQRDFESKTSFGFVATPANQESNATSAYYSETSYPYLPKGWL